MTRSYVDEAFEKVPDLGAGRRWYDPPYKILSWLLTSWRRKLLPEPVRERLTRGMSYLSVFHQHDLDKVWSLDDPLHNAFVPNDDHVNVPGLWVVELFPPSEFGALSDVIEHNSWDSRRLFITGGEGNREMLEQSRTGAGWTWWRLAEIESVDSTYRLFPDAIREKLPDAFAAVQLRAIQIGTGLTAVLAFFRLTDAASNSVDITWHMRREPQLVHINGRLRAESRLWATGRITQEARRAAHDAARDWMARRCPGFFVANGEAQLLMDMLLMDKFDPIPGERTPREHSDALRALGITGFEHRTSPDVPHMLLCPVDGSLCRAFEGKRTWTLWGNREAIAGATEHLDMYGTDKNLAIALNANKRMANFLVMLAVSDFLAIMEAKYAVLRDSARAGHGSFKASGLRHLRESFLTLSLDLTSVERDVDTFWRRKWRDEGDAQFTLDLAPWIVESQKALGAKRFAPIDLNDELRNRQGEQFKTLIAADRDYREILSTVASLGASADAFRTGRVALWVALGSLGVALVTLLVTDVAGHTMLEGLISWLRSHIGF